MTNESSRTVYIETSVVSYLTARSTSSSLVAAWQIATTEWRDTHGTQLEFFMSTLTTEEAGRGHREAAARRLEALAGIALLSITEAVTNLADSLIRRQALPANAETRSLIREIMRQSRVPKSGYLYGKRTFGRYGTCRTKSLRNCGESRTVS